jgi:hypothetical protein
MEETAGEVWYNRAPAVQCRGGVEMILYRISGGQMAADKVVKPGTGQDGILRRKDGALIAKRVLGAGSGLIVAAAALLVRTAGCGACGTVV